MNLRFLIILFCLYSTNSNSQGISPEIIAATGDSFQNSTIQLDLTLGELAVSSMHNLNMKLTQGFHQPRYFISSVNEFSTVLSSIKVFPNPTPDDILVELSFDQQKSIQITIVDVNGKLIFEKAIVDKQINEHIELGSVPAGSYFLYLLIENDKYPLTYKIQKIY